MANAWYGKTLELAVETGLGWTADSIRAFLQCSEHYTPDLAADDQLADVVSGGAVTATSDALADKTNALGVLNATDKVFTAVADNGHYIDYVGLYNDTDAGDPLLMLWDNGTGIPVYANGGDITVIWGNVAGTLLAKI